MESLKIVINRVSHVSCCAKTYDVEVDGLFVGKLKNGSSLAIPTTAGPHAISFLSFGKTKKVVSVVISPENPVLEISVCHNNWGKLVVTTCERQEDCQRRPLDSSRRAARNKIVSLLCFLAVWLVASFFLIILGGVIFDGEEFMPGYYGIVIFTAPIALGVLTVWLRARNSVEGTPHEPTYCIDEKIYNDAVRFVIHSKTANVTAIQRRFGIGYTQAAQILDKMESNGIVGPFAGSQTRDVLVNCSVSTPAYSVDSGIDFSRYGGIDADMMTVDLMGGHEFECYCADILRRNGFQNVEVTPGSGDQGVDVLAEKDGVRYAIQCKCYSSDLGNTPVQEVNAGKVFYHCHIGAVITNRFFTQGAKDAATATGVLLWDRNKLKELIESAKRT